MKHEYGKKAPLVRLVFAVAALSATVSVGGFVDFLATDYVVLVGEKHRTVLVAERKS